MTTDALLELLLVAVPMWTYEKVRHMTPDERTARGVELAGVVGAHGDDILYRGRHTRDAFNALAEGLAIASFASGGVTFRGLHFEDGRQVAKPLDTVMPEV